MPHKALHSPFQKRNKGLFYLTITIISLLLGNAHLFSKSSPLPQRKRCVNRAGVKGSFLLPDTCRWKVRRRTVLIYSMLIRIWHVACLGLERLLEKLLIWCMLGHGSFSICRVYGPFYRIDPKSEFETWKKVYFSPKNCMHANCIISKVHISSNCAVNSHIVFSESFGIFVLSPNLSLPKHSNKNLIRRVILTYKDFTCI